LRASGFSSTGALSTNTRKPKRTDGFRHPVRELLQALAQKLVIVAAERVTRNVRRLAVGKRLSASRASSGQ